MMPPLTGSQAQAGGGTSPLGQALMLLLQLSSQTPSARLVLTGIIQHSMHTLLLSAFLCLGSIQFQRNRKEVKHPIPAIWELLINVGENINIHDE